MYISKLNSFNFIMQTHVLLIPAAFLTTATYKDS